MTNDEAREAAWREWAGLDHAHAVARTAFTAGWDARGQHDKEQIAALEEAAKWWLGNTGPHYDENGLPNRVRRALGMAPFQVCTCSSCSDVRALAGQSEETTGE